MAFQPTVELITEYPTHSSDTESSAPAAQKQKSAFKFPINFPGIFTRSKQQTQQTEEGAATAANDDEEAARSEATVIIEDEPKVIDVRK